MNSIGKFQVYYEKIATDVSMIKEREGYDTLSKAFAHWFLEKFEKMNNQEIAESIMDGMNDNGIDAIVLLNEKIQLYQFKFPDKIKNIDKAVDEATILKLQNGYKKLTSDRTPKKANEVFLSFRELIKEKSIFDYEFIFVSYTNDLSEHAIDSLSTAVETIKKETGNEIKYQIISKKKICDLLDKSQKRFAAEIQLKYTRLDPSYNLEQEGDSWSGFANAKDVLTACKDVMDIIFDENIRLYEGNVPVNAGIKKTATGDDSKYFYFFHNGIVFICDKCQNSTGNQTARLSAASVVNGCQTIVSLQQANEAGLLNNDVFVPIRIIETDNFDLRAKITEYLNSQSKIKDSYFLANNIFVKELQNQLSSEGYFLERLSNEYTYKFKLKKVNEYPREKIITLEKTIQIYVAYYNNEYAATAKRGKNDLFNRDIIDSLLCHISAKRVLLAYQYYWQISGKITLYRKCRRSRDKKMAFLNYLGYSEKDMNDRYDELMDKYIFLNTGDLLLINAFSNLKANASCNKKTDEDIIKIAINICYNCIAKQAPKSSPSAATKNASIFSGVQQMCESSKICEKLE
jgi:hypothetical protein